MAPLGQMRVDERVYIDPSAGIQRYGAPSLMADEKSCVDQVADGHANLVAVSYDLPPDPSYEGLSWKVTSSPALPPHQPVQDISPDLIVTETHRQRYI